MMKADDYAECAIISQQLKDVMRASPHWQRALSYAQRQALDDLVYSMAYLLVTDIASDAAWAQIAGVADMMLGQPEDDLIVEGDPNA